MILLRLSSFSLVPMCVSMLRIVPFICLVASVGYAQEAPKAITYEVTKTLNVVYNVANNADATRHKLDVYTPKTNKKFPMMMFVHGGSWNSGSKDLYAALGNTFAQQGIGTVVINYRLSRADNNVKHPDHIHDVAKAFAWMKANAKKLGADDKKLYIAGHSAGGHLVALLATDEKYLKAEGCTFADIKGVIPISGVYTIVNLVPVFHRPFGKEADDCKAASPITHVKGSLPPFLVAYAEKDFPTLDRMAEDFEKKLKEHKNTVELLKLEKRDHISIIISLAADAKDPLGQAMVKFVTR